jgi:hypothetical protein
LATRKTNLAVLEVAGYLLIDEPKDWKIIAAQSPEGRNGFGEGALRDVAPDDARIIEFEKELQIRLGDQVRHIIEDVRDLAEPACLEDIERRIKRLLSHVHKTLTDERLPREAKEHVLNEANEAFRKLTAQRNKLARRPNKQGETLFTRETVNRLINETPY